MRLSPATELVKDARGGGRLRELDGLRGLAALTVVLHHALLVLPAFYLDTGWAKVLDSPLHVAFAGTEAVILFFVLSGFVLALPFVAGVPIDQESYGRFVIHRFFRLWPAYAVAITLGLIARAAFVNNRGAGLSLWFSEMWRSHIHASDYLAHYSMVAPFDDSQIVPVTWSLNYEMRISIVFPVLAWLVLRHRTRWVLSSVVVIGALASVISIRVGYATELDTVYYGSMFVVGVALAKHRHDIADWFSTRMTWPLLPSGVLLYTAPWTARGLGVPVDIIVRECVVAGSAAFIVAALNMPGFRSALRWQPVQFLGDISYSLYLIHTIVLLAVLHLFAGHAPLALLIIVSVIASFPAAWALRRWVEIPSIAVGRRLTWRPLREARNPPRSRHPERLFERGQYLGDASTRRPRGTDHRPDRHTHSRPRDLGSARDCDNPDSAGGQSDGVEG